jgi:RecJ-like exonuclease
MVKKMVEIRCGDCGKKLSERDEICSNCGSKKLHQVLILEEKLEIHERIKGKIKEKGAKPVQEFTAGDDLHRKSEKWHHREMYIDRKNDSYREIVKDKTTGEIIHKCEEPLSEHIGHGSAKHKKESETNEG